MDDRCFSKLSRKIYHLHKRKIRVVMNLPYIILLAWNKLRNNRNSSFSPCSFYFGSFLVNLPQVLVLKAEEKISPSTIKMSNLAPCTFIFEAIGVKLEH